MSTRIILPLALLLAFVLAACNTATPRVTAVEIAGGDRTLEPGAQTVLTALVAAGSGIDTGVTWSSDAAAVASVSADGTLVAHDLGTATVTATSVADTSKSDSITVTVAADPASPQTVDATYIPSETSLPALGAALFFQPGPVIASASFTEAMEGLYFGPVSPISATGELQLTLPDTTDVPAELMGTAEDFLLFVADMTDCSLTASEPSVGVTFAGMPLGLTNGAAIFKPDGAMPALVTDAPLDPDDMTESAIVGVGHVFWVYAEEAVTVEATGAGCTAVPTDLIVDLELDPGWNQLTWKFELDETDVTGISLHKSDGVPVYLVEFAAI